MDKMPRRKSHRSKQTEVRDNAKLSINEISDNDRGKIIRIFRNGDMHDHGREIVASTEKYPKFEAFLDYLTKSLDVRWPIHHVYGLDGYEVYSIGGFESGESYVAAQKEFIKMDYSPNGTPNWRKVYQVRDTPYVSLRSTVKIKSECSRSKSHDKDKKKEKKEHRHKHSSRYAD